MGRGIFLPQPLTPNPSPRTGEGRGSGGVTAEAAAAERARRELARRRLIDFSCYVAPWYRPAAHHRLVAERLEQVELFIQSKGKEGIGRLIINEPPRHGKTEQVARLFPAWLMGRNPDARVILTSYGADLAQDDSRAVRAYLTSERYQALFGGLSAVDEPVALSEDSRAKANWELAPPHRGGVVAAGVGGGITGRGAHLLVIDDPFKSREEAESEAQRRRVMSWYRSSAYTRLEDGAAIVIIHTRWHPEDLAGQLLTAMANDPLLTDQWEVLFLPAMALKAEDYAREEREFQDNLLRGLYLPTEDPLGRKAGEPLWEEKYDRGALLKTRESVTDFEFTALYQQLPRPMEGGFFDEKDLAITDTFPEGLGWCRYVDLALGKSDRSDFNTTVGVGLDEESGVVFLRDMLRVRELAEFLNQLVEWMLSPKESGVVWGIEDVAFQSLVWRDLMKNTRLANVAIVPVKPLGDKVARARPLQTRAKQGLVRIVRGAWNRSFINEAMVFPNGQHDDQVDTASGGLQMVSLYGRGRRKGQKARSYQG